MNVATWLSRAAAARPDADAIIAAQGAGWRRVGFRELDTWTDALAAGFTRHGIGRGARTLLLVRAGVDLIAVTYALFKAGAVPVLIDPGMGRAGFLRCVKELAPTCFVGIPLGHVARLLNPGTFASVERHVTVGRRWFWGGPTLGSLAADGAAGFTPVDARDDEEAAILFTSGSTGPAKGVVYTHGNFNAQVHALKASYGFAPGEVDCAAFPLFSLFDNALEMTSVIPDLDPSRPGTCDPAKVARALREHHCTTAFGSPAIWRRVAPWAAQNGVSFPGLKRILIAGASVPPSLIEALHGCLPDGDVGTPYGATESLPVSTLFGKEVLAETAALTRTGAGTCVGYPAPGITVKLLAVTDAPLPRLADATEVPDGEVGEITVCGEVVTRSYARRPDADALAKITDGDRVWHRIGDVGYRDTKGRLWFCGRKSERLQTATGTLYTDRVEGRLAPVAGGRRVALVGPGPIGAQTPVLVVEGPPDERLRVALLAEGVVPRVEFHPTFPVDVRHNAKINRIALKAWLETAFQPARRG